ncbi:unnamed protein product, partial [Allacma fusca]
MLDAWRKFVVTTDPDVLTGYNINKFDIPFLLDRARVIRASKLPYFGRIVKSPVSSRKILNETKRMNKFADTISSVSGRVVFDMLPVIRQLFPNMQSFTLGNDAWLVSKLIFRNPSDIEEEEE